MTGPAPIFEGQMGFEKELGVSMGDVGEVFDKTKEAMPGEGPASMILKTSIKYWPAEYHSQSAIEAALVSAQPNRGSVAGENDGDREPRRVGGYHRERAGEMAAAEPRDSGPQPAVHHGGGADRWRGDGQAVRAGAFHGDRRSWQFLQGVKVERNEELSALYAEAVANIVHVNLADGRTLDQARRLSARATRRTGSRIPRWKGNFSTCRAEDRRRAGADKVVEHCWKLDEAKDVGCEV